MAAYCWSISLVSESFICLRAAIRLVTVAFASSSALRAAVTARAEDEDARYRMRDEIHIGYKIW